MTSGTLDTNLRGLGGVQGNTLDRLGSDIDGSDIGLSDPGPVDSSVSNNVSNYKNGRQKEEQSNCVIYILTYGTGNDSGKR